MTKQEIKKYANQQIGTDTTPYEVIRIVSDKTVEVREMDVEQIVFPQNFQSGGFSAHCVDNHNQKYEYKSNEENPIRRIRFSKKKNNWFDNGGKRYYMDDNPICFYDYNF